MWILGKGNLVRLPPLKIRYYCTKMTENKKSRQYVKERRLAGAVVTQNSSYLPLVYRQIDAVDGLNFGLSTVLKATL